MTQKISIKDGDMLYVSIDGDGNRSVKDGVLLNPGTSKDGLAKITNGLGPFEIVFDLNEKGEVIGIEIVS